MPKFIFANSNNKSKDPSSNSGDIFIPFDSINFSTYFLELELGSKNIKGYWTISSNEIFLFDKSLYFSPQTKISFTSLQGIISKDESLIGRLQIAISISPDLIKLQSSRVVPFIILNLILGYLLWKVSKYGSKKYFDIVSPAPIFNSPIVKFLNSNIFSSPTFIKLIAELAYSNKRLPSFVKDTPFDVLLKSLISSSFSSCIIAWLTAGCVI